MSFGAARPARPFLLMADALSPVTPAAAAALWQGGVRVLGRYLETLRADEVKRHFALGFSLVLITEGREDELTAPLGVTVGQAHAKAARDLGAPQGVHVTLDHESNLSPDAPLFLTNAGAALLAGGYQAMLYLGAGQALTGRQAYALTTINRYWRGGSAGIPEPACGFAITQGYPLDQSLASLCQLSPTAESANERFDISFVGQDYRGRAPSLWSPS